jgi:hypothetical protein
VVDLGVGFDDCLLEPLDVLLTFAASGKLAGLYLQRVLFLIATTE